MCISPYFLYVHAYGNHSGRHSSLKLRYLRVAVRGMKQNPSEVTEKKQMLFLPPPLPGEGEAPFGVIAQ